MAKMEVDMVEHHYWNFRTVGFSGLSRGADILAQLSYMIRTPSIEALTEKMFSITQKIHH